MKQRRIDCLLITAFLLLSLIPSLGILVVGESKAAANEILTARPVLWNRDGSFRKQVLSDSADYFADHFAFRQEFSTAWAKLNALLLGSSVEEQVLVGTDGWLYYGATADDYRGLGLSDRALAYAARNLFLMQEYAESTGARLLFTIAPNKNSLYPENMPAYVPHEAAGSNGARLPAFLKAYGVNYADLFTPFRAEERLYFKTDSHWNSRGAALAADTLLAALGRDNSYFRDSFSESEPHRGDLYEMLYPAGQETEADPVYSGALAYLCHSDPKGGNAITIETASENGTGRLLCWRDSFGIALYPYLADAYESAVFSRASVYDLTLIGQYGADTVILELVERNLSRLFENAPVFPAPERDTPALVSGGESLIHVKEEAGASGDLKQITGQIPESAMDEGSPVYLLIGEGCYEACVIQGAEPGTLGFSAWVDPSAGETAAVALRLDGQWTACPVRID